MKPSADELIAREPYLTELANRLIPLPKGTVTRRLNKMVKGGMLAEWEISYVRMLITVKVEFEPLVNDLLRQVCPEIFADTSPAKRRKRVKRDGPPRPKRPRPTLPPAEA